MPKQSRKSAPASTIATLESPAHDEQYPDYFYEADLKTINASGQWVQFCIFLATVGFPCDDRFVEVISTLAKWFAFFEFYSPEIDRARTKEVLRLFCLRKHNGFITRLNNGQVEDVLAHVDRVVDGAIDSTSEEGLRLFAEMRATRDRGHYPVTYRLEDLCTTNNSSSSLLSCPILCGILRDKQNEDWTYIPDETELPEKLMEMVQNRFRQEGVRLRKDKTGKYPTLNGW